jgi:hypothetical protein
MIPKTLTLGLFFLAACTPKAFLVPKSYGCQGGGGIRPLRSLHQDPAPVRVQRNVTRFVGHWSVARTPEVLFEREAAPTSFDLHAVGRLGYQRFLACGDRGTVLVRDPDRGWEPEASGTNADLRAFDSVFADGARSAVTLVVGSGGAAVTRTSDGRWSSESTGTDQDLNGITSVVRTTKAPIVERSPDGAWPVVDYSVVVGASGTMLERSAAGRWTVIPAGTSADLLVVRGCGKDRVCALGDRGESVACTRSNEQFTCSVTAERADDAAHEVIARSELTTRDDLRRITVARDGTLTLFADRASYRPYAASVRLPYGPQVDAAELDVADGFLVGRAGLIVHVSPSAIAFPSTCLE